MHVSSVASRRHPSLCILLPCLLLPTACWSTAIKPFTQAFNQTTDLYACAWYCFCASSSTAATLCSSSSATWSSCGWAGARAVQRAMCLLKHQFQATRDKQLLKQCHQSSPAEAR